MSTDHALSARLSSNISVEGIAAPAPAPPVLERLHALVRKGYRARIGENSETDIVVLRHPARAPDLILHGNGVVEGFDGRRPFYKRDIAPPAAITTQGAGDDLCFLKFLDTIPATSFRDRTRRVRHKYVYFPAFLLALWGGCMALTGMVLSM